MPRVPWLPGSEGEARILGITVQFSWPHIKHKETTGAQVFEMLTLLNDLEVYDALNVTTQMSILIICGVFICKCAYLLEFICNFQMKTCSILVVMHGYAQGSEKFASSKMHFPY